MPSIVEDKARISTCDTRSLISAKGSSRDSSGGKQLYDSGLKYDSGLYYDRWGNNPIQGDGAKVNLTKD